jgi:hypothetical protein
MQNQAPPQNFSGGYYPQNSNLNQYDMNQFQQRFVPNVQPVPCLKGRPVVSIEEARAAQIDLDGSLHIFTDIGNKKIYTKQINLDGTATLNVYSLEEPTMVETQQIEYVTKTEFSEEIDKIQSLLNLLIPKDNKELTFKNF